MARPPKNHLAQQQLASNIKRLARAKRNFSVKDIEKCGWQNDLDVGNQSIRNALNGDIDPTGCAVELLILLSKFFEVAPAELGTYAEERITKLYAIALPGGDGNGPEGGREQGTSASGWLELIPHKAIKATEPDLLLVEAA